MESRSTTQDLGKLRRTARISDSDGFIRVAAIDHPDTYAILFDPDVSSVTFEEVVESKVELVTAMAPHATAMLLDPTWSIGPSVAGGALPGDVGLISGLEDLYYTPETSTVGFDTELRLKPGWTPEKLAALGCDAAKLVVFHRHDGPDDRAEQVHAVVREVAEECTRLQLPLVVEPLWFPLPDEDLGDPDVATRRAESVVASARSFREAGADIMKMEFPVALSTDHGRAAADAWCEKLDAAVDGPWVLLSAGVTFDGFVDQLTVAARHGCVGFMAGRAIWGDAVGRHPADVRAAGARRAAERLDRLGDLMAEHGSTDRAWRPSADLAAQVGPDWYRTFGEA
jgi:tagatose-1,6-bisphosphate aldolase